MESAGYGKVWYWLHKTILILRKKGDVIFGLDKDLNQIGKVFHAGTATNEKGEVVTNGGPCVVCHPV